MRIGPHMCFLVLVSAILSRYLIFHHFLTDMQMMFSHLFLILSLKGILPPRLYIPPGVCGWSQSLSWKSHIWQH